MSIARARSLRRNQTDAERKLWYALRARHLVGLKFKRQVSIGRFFADFLCFECRLIVELDGTQHAEQGEYDNARTHWLESQGYRVQRFWNFDVLTNTDAVVDEIMRVATERRPKR